jgi:hypothetical protein
VIVAPAGEEAMHWIINHQLGRRNLEALQRDMLIGRRHELEKGIQGGATNQTVKMPV